MPLGSGGLGDEPPPGFSYFASGDGKFDFGGYGGPGFHPDFFPGHPHGPPGNPPLPFSPQGETPFSIYISYLSCGLQPVCASIVRKQNIKLGRYRERDTKKHKLLVDSKVSQLFYRFFG